MSSSDYMFSVGVGAAFISLFSLPYLFAASLVPFSGALPSKKSFVLVSGIATYGGACFVALVCSPFFFVGEYLGVQLVSDGYKTIGLLSRRVSSYAPYVVVVFWFVFAFAIPLYLRAGVWQRLVAANKPLQPIAPKDGAPVER